MNYSKILWGLILIGLGFLFLLDNLGYIFFSWGQIWRLWPLALVFWGISLIPVNDYIKLALSLLALTLGIYILVEDKPATDQEFQSSTSTELNQRFQTDWKPAIKQVNVELEATAGIYRISGASSSLFEFKNEGNFGSYNLDQTGNDSIVFLDISPMDDQIQQLENIRNIVELSLHPSPTYNFNIDAGAAKMDLDFSQLRTSSVNIDGGATKLEIHIGERQDSVHLDLDAGASSIRLFIPENSGCEIRSDNVLTSKSFKGFSSPAKGVHQTPNFQKSQRKIWVTSQMAVASFEVRQYSPEP